MLLTHSSIYHNIYILIDYVEICVFHIIYYHLAILSYDYENLQIINNKDIL